MSEPLQPKTPVADGCPSILGRTSSALHMLDDLEHILCWQMNLCASVHVKMPDNSIHWWLSVDGHLELCIVAHNLYLFELYIGMCYGSNICHVHE